MELNKIIQSFVNEVVKVEVSGKNLINGTVIDLGSDMIVLYNGISFMYIPLVHIQGFEIDSDNESDIKAPTEFPSVIAEENEVDLSFSGVLSQVKGKYVEIYVTGGRPLHGRITSIMNDYFVFNSPIYKTMYISLNHLKWLIPYSQNERPYGLDGYAILLEPDNNSLASTLEAQVKKVENKMVVFNIDGNKSHIGIVNKIEGQIVEIQTARAHPIYLNLHHIKTFHQI